MWPHMLFGPYHCVYGALFGIRLSYGMPDQIFLHIFAFIRQVYNKKKSPFCS